jgi:hypothetical protein
MKRVKWQFMMKLTRIIGAKAEGVMEGKLDDARKMLTKQMPEDLITEITGISKEELGNERLS